MLPSSDPALFATLEAFGGWETFQRGGDSDRLVDRTEFESLYRLMAGNVGA